MAGFEFGEGIRKLFLAGVGTVATVAEKSQVVFEDLVKKGEAAVGEGKAINEELTRKATKTANDAQDTLLRVHLESMTAEERAAYAKKVADMAADIDEKATTVEVEVEVVEVEEPAEAAEAVADAEAAEATDDESEAADE